MYPDASWQRVVVLRALEGLGDILCSVPALRALRAALPNAHIAVIAGDKGAAVLERFPAYVDEIIAFPGYPGLGGDYPHQLPAFLAATHERTWDLALQMHGSGIVSNPFLALLGARDSAGFYLPSQWCPDERLFWPYPSHEPEVRRWLQLTAHLGARPQGEQLEFRVTDTDRDELAAALDGHRLEPGTYAVVHPGAAHFARRWPPERFASVIDELASRGLDIVVTGTAAEADLAHEVAARATADPLVLAGRTQLGPVAALLEGARLVVCNDTGVSHLAAALAVPSVVIFTWSDPDRWAPLDRTRHRVVAQASVEQNPCRHNEIVQGHRCLGDGCAANARTDDDLPTAFASVDAVLAETEELLDAART